MLKSIPDVLTVGELADYLKVSKRSAYMLLHEGEIRYRKIGRVYRIPKTALLQYLQKN